ncbi:glycosyltransferase [Nocardia sp. CDC160]|uniref:glycosyltransferase n=1 Tax=Nocardia sp. CDC160 TaxID=3112166 RepID=UPI002DB9166C|nr:glycosyltransferase [Nocardia sp. CDC160]MEC3919195.1 glycosyltransferase [Nocardia sp. CDC160]
MAAINICLVVLAALHVLAAVIVSIEVFTGRTGLRWNEYSAAGMVLWGSLLGITGTGTVRLFLLLIQLSVDPVTLVLLWVVGILGFVRTVPGLVRQYEGWDCVIRRRWHRGGTILTRPLPPNPPFVTIEVPVHAEPPDIVIATLDHLSQLDYPAFDVLVIDNNTADPALWRPIEDHCERLGPRFRFVHVEGISGAKAGALNWARPLVNPRTALIALVDADYQVDPRWLRDTVGQFDDPDLGFVQSPHAYRDFEHSGFQRMVNAGYQWAQATEMVSRDEKGAGITVGTVSLIRLTALDEVGGWAEWCMTEDSEFAIRVHAAGWQSLFVPRVYGRGLIPQTFSELKKQRYRWTYGPGQEFKRHWRLFVPGPWRRPSRLTRTQRWRHGNYDLVILTVGVGVLSLPISGALLISMAMSGNVPPVIPSVLIGTVAILVARRLIRWAIYRKVIGTDNRTTLGGMIALMAVTPTITGAGLDVLLGRRTSFQRTDKFDQQPSLRRALASARTETGLAICCLTAAILVPILLPPEVGTYLLTLSFVWLTVLHSTALALAIRAEFDLANNPIAVRCGCKSGSVSGKHEGDQRKIQGLGGEELPQGSSRSRLLRSTSNYPGADVRGDADTVEL